MLTWIRNKFGPAIISLIIGFIAFVFIFYGIYNPKSTQGIHEGAVAGTVNGEPISVSEFTRSLNQRMEFFKNMAGGGLTEEQIKAFRLRDGVFQELVSRKLMAQAAESYGLVASDEEVRVKIMEIPAFKKNDKFDTVTYEAVLRNNNYTPSRFEKSMKEDLSVQRLNQFFKDRAHVTENELKKEFILTEDKRNLKYVLLTSDAGKKDIQIQEADIQKFLKDEKKVNLAKTRYDSKKMSEYKGKEFDAVKSEIARDLLALEKSDEIAKINEKLAKQVESMMTADKGSDTKINAMLKTYGVEVKSTGLVTRTNPFLPGIGEAKEVLADAFAQKSPIDPAQGGHAKAFRSANWWLVAIITEAKHPDFSKFTETADSLRGQVASKKEKEVMEAFMKELNDKAKIERNDAVVGGAAES